MGGSARRLEEDADLDDEQRDEETRPRRSAW
jgi:hypothetical protein